MSASFREHIEELAGRIGERNVWNHAALERAADYIRSSLATSGGRIADQEYRVLEKTVRNVELTIEGTTRPNEIIVFGAHYDTVRGCPGANDNASGVAALIELARSHAARGGARTVRFVAFVNEEPPFFQTGFMGSVVYAKRCRVRNDHVVGMVTLETMGYYSDEKGSQEYPVGVLKWLYPDTGNFIAAVANFASRALLRDVKRAFTSASSFPVQAAAVPMGIPGVSWSDHWSFWQERYQALMFTDTAPFRYPHYHMPTDTPDKIDYSRLGQLVQALDAVVQGLAKS